MAVIMALCIIAFNILNNTSVIDAVYILSSYTYGPILGFFTFGMISKRAVRDKWVPVVAAAAPILCFILEKTQKHCSVVTNFATKYLSSMPSLPLLV